MLIHTFALVSSLFTSLRRAASFHISYRELPRYFRKSMNLALCYTGLVSKRNIGQAMKAGIAAFLSCAYDVVTDWRNFDPVYLAAYERILAMYSPIELQCIVLDMLEKDHLQTLSDDGLERGINSTLFVTGLIGSKADFEKMTDITRLGMALQIVDDVLDYEEDVIQGDTNCLTSDQGREYLRLLAETFPKSETIRLFPYGPILRLIIQRSLEKAATLTFR